MRRVDLVRPSLGALAFMVAALVTPLVASGAFPAFSDPYTQKDDGNCTQNAVDPINVVFAGSVAGLDNTVDQIETHADWHTSSGSAQNLTVRVSSSGYACRGQGAQRANNSLVESRFHTRLWLIPHTQGTNDKDTVGDAHHEDFEEFRCFPPSHAVDSNGSTGSGFDWGRRELRDEFDRAGHVTANHNWGNTRNFRQCDGDYAGSNGSGVNIHIGHQQG